MSNAATSLPVIPADPGLDPGESRNPVIKAARAFTPAVDYWVPARLAGTTVRRVGKRAATYALRSTPERAWFAHPTTPRVVHLQTLLSLRFPRANSCAGLSRMCANLSLCRQPLGLSCPASSGASSNPRMPGRGKAVPNPTFLLLDRPHARTMTTYGLRGGNQAAA